MLNTNKLNIYNPNLDVIQLRKQTDKSFGYDLAVSEDIFMVEGEFRLLPTGIKLQPANNDQTLLMTIVPRSSLFMRYGLIVTNSPGIIDADYTEEIKICAYKMPGVDKMPPTCYIDRGTRVAQAIFLKPANVTILIHRTEITPENPRFGFGSTGE